MLIYLSFYFVILLLLLNKENPYGDHNEPTWPQTCNFTQHQRRIIRSFHYYKSSLNLPTQPECETLCEGEMRCGSYKWFSSKKRCELYQITPAMLERVVGLPQEAWLHRQSTINTGSKDCTADISEPACNYTDKYNRTIPNLKYKFADIHTRPNFIINASQCQAFCNTHETCKSVYHMKHVHISKCSLFNTTIRELIEDGKERRTDGVSKGVTYDKGNCSDVRTAEVVTVHATTGRGRTSRGRTSRGRTSRGRTSRGRTTGATTPTGTTTRGTTTRGTTTRGTTTKDTAVRAGDTLTSAAPNNQDNGITTAAIVIIVINAILFLIGAGALFYCWRKRLQLPDKSREELQAIEAKPEFSKVEPESSKVEPESSKVEPESSKVEPESSKVEPESSKVEPESSNIQHEPSETQPTASEDKDKTSLNKNVASSPARYHIEV